MSKGWKNIFTTNEYAASMHAVIGNFTNLLYIKISKLFIVRSYKNPQNIFKKYMFK